jgi:hypothetical protein
MAEVSALTPLTVSNALDAARTIKSVDRNWTRMPGDMAMAMQTFGYGPAITRLSEGFSFIYVKDKVKPRKVTLTIDPGAGAGSNVITMSSFDAALIGVGQTLYFTDGEVMWVTANTSSTSKTVTRGFGGTTTAAKTSAALKGNVYIGPQIHLDTGDFQNAGVYRGDLASIYPTLTHYTISESLLRTTVDTWVNKNPDEMAEERERKMAERANELEVMVLYGVEQQPTATNPGSFKGIIPTITTNTLNVASAAWTATMIANAHQTIKRINTAGEQVLIGGYTAKRIFDAILRLAGTVSNQAVRMETRTNEVGVTFERFMLNTGPISWVTIPMMEDLSPATVLMVRPEDIKLRPIQHKYGSGWLRITRDFAITGNPVAEEVELNVLTLHCQEERQHYKFTSIDLTASTYSGYV